MYRIKEMDYVSNISNISNGIGIKGTVLSIKLEYALIRWDENVWNKSVDVTIDYNKNIKINTRRLSWSSVKYIKLESSAIDRLIRRNKFDNRRKN